MFTIDLKYLDCVLRPIMNVSWYKSVGKADEDEGTSIAPKLIVEQGHRT